MTKITAWSYSRYACYELCPAKFKYQHIDKLPMPDAPAMMRGNEVHKHVADYLTGAMAYPPAEAQAHAFPLKLIDELRCYDDKVVEQQWGFTQKWEPTGWFGKDTWFRAVLDAAVMYDDMSADVLDWKTGKRYGSNADQMELNGLALLRHFKPATRVTSRMVYLDIGDEDLLDIEAADAPKLMAKWEKKVEPMFSDEQFLPRPNDKCRFCPFSRSKEGPCRFG